MTPVAVESDNDSAAIDQAKNGIHTEHVAFESDRFPELRIEVSSAKIDLEACERGRACRGSTADFVARSKIEEDKNSPDVQVDLPWAHRHEVRAMTKVGDGQKFRTIRCLQRVIVKVQDTPALTYHVKH